MEKVEFKLKQKRNVTRKVKPIHTSPSRNADGTWNLSPREYEVLMWAAKGKTYTETASIMNVAFSSVHCYMSMLKMKLNAINIAHAVALAYERGILQHDTVAYVPLVVLPPLLLKDFGA